MRLESIERVLNNAFKEYQEEGLQAIIILMIDTAGKYSTSWATDDSPHYLQMVGILEQVKFDFMNAKENRD